MPTANPLNWRLPSLLKIAKIFLAVSMLGYVIMGIQAVVQGAHIGQALMTLAVAGIVWGLMFRERLAGYFSKASQ